MMMKSVLFLFHSNSDYLIEHLQDFIFYGVYALLSLLLAVPAWFVVYGWHEKGKRKKETFGGHLGSCACCHLG